MKQKLFFLIKIISTICITGALGLEFWSVYLNLTSNSLPRKLNSVLLLVSIALIAHGIEGTIAAFNANNRSKNPITYGIYTFFVGFVGLRKLFDIKD